jgi:hypothetical protein
VLQGSTFDIAGEAFPPSSNLLPPLQPVRFVMDASPRLEQGLIEEKGCRQHGDRE